jgi:nucleotide-binding universal stress UspA family protein
MLMGSVTAQVISRARADVLVVKRPSWGWSARAGAADGAPPPAADAPVPRLEAQRSPDHRGEYRSILVPYDGSTFGKSALARACDIARADGSVVAALYAIPRYEEMVGFLRTEGISARLDEEAAKIVAEARQQAAASGVTIATSIAGGAADSRIVESVRKSGFDLVVMGSHGHRGMDRALPGSTAERVIVNAPCPVLVVKEKR